MAVGLLEAAPLSSGEFQVCDPDRLESVERKHRDVSAWLEKNGCDGMLLSRPENFAWFSSGGSSVLFPGGEPTASLFITKDARVVLCANTESGELFDRHLTGMGFLLKERPWYEARPQLCEDVVRGRRVVADSPIRGARCDACAIAELRLPLDEFESRRYRELGKQVAHAVEATARTMSLGQTEAETAGQLAHRLLKHEAVPLRMQVAADGRARLYRHWTFSDAVIRKWAMISATARKDGLVATASRVVCFGNLPEPLVNFYNEAAMLAATAFAFSQAEQPLGEVWQRVQRIYEKLGVNQEWTLADQGGVTGYSPMEIPIRPKSELVLRSGMPLVWTPSVGPVVWGDTIMVRPDSVEYLTAPDQWPLMTISVKGQAISVPDLLCRESV
jgi:Xaa-Pro dipeptidase